MVDDGPPATPGVQVRLLDRDAVPIAPASIIDLDDDSGYQLVAESAFASDESAIAVIASGGGSTGLFTLTLGDDGPGVPWRADTELPGSTYVTDVAYLTGDAQLVVATHDPEMDTDGLALAPANADAPGGIVPIATTLAGEQLEYTGSTSDGTMLAYYVYDDDAEVSRGYVVDIATLPAAPIELVLPAPETRLTSLQIAPDDSGVAYAVRVPMEPLDESSLWWSALEDGLPQPPVELTADYPRVYGVTAWSPDARWMALRADGEPGTRLLVRLDDGVPSAPFDLGPLVDSLADTRRSFTSDGWHYYLTEIDGDQALLRVDVTGDIPGAPQMVIGPVGDVIVYEISADASTLVINTADMFAGDYDGFAIDLTGSEPGEPVQINAPMAPGEWVYRLDVTPNGRGIAYERRSADASGRYGHYVDVATPGMALTLADGVEINGVSVRALP